MNRQFSHKIKLGGGIDFSYNEAYAAKVTMTDGTPEKAPYSFNNKFLIGIFPSFELVINNLTILIQPGYFIYRQKVENVETPTAYQRIGIRYYILKHFITGVNIRAYNFSKADFVEFNFGYSLRWKKTYRKK